MRAVQNYAKNLISWDKIRNGVKAKETNIINFDQPLKRDSRCVVNGVFAEVYCIHYTAEPFKLLWLIVFRLFIRHIVYMAFGI